MGPCLRIQSEDLQFRGVHGPSRSQRGRSASRGRKEREGLRAPFSDLVGWAKDTGLLCPGARRTASGAGGEGSWAGGSAIRSSQRRRQLGRGSPVRSRRRTRQLLVSMEAQRRARVRHQEEGLRQQTGLEVLGPWLWGLEWRGSGLGATGGRLEQQRQRQRAASQDLKGGSSPR